MKKLALMLAVMVGIFSSTQNVFAANVSSSVNVDYSYDHYRQTYVVEVTVNSGVLLDAEISVLAEVYLGTTLEQSHEFKSSIYRHNYYRKIVLEPFHDLQKRTIAVYVLTPDDQEQPIKQFVFDTFQNSYVEREIQATSYEFEFPFITKLSKDGAITSKEQVNFSNLLNVESFMKDAKTTFENWTYSYKAMGENGYPLSNGADIYFSRGFEGSNIPYVEGKGYHFALLSKSVLDNGFQFYLKDPVYYNPITKVYSVVQTTDQFILMQDLDFKMIQNEVQVVLDIHEHGVNKMNYVLHFSFTPSKPFTPDEPDNPIRTILSSVCDSGKYCITKKFDELTLVNYSSYKVGD